MAASPIHALMCLAVVALAAWVGGCAAPSTATSRQSPPSDTSRPDAADHPKSAATQRSSQQLEAAIAALPLIHRRMSDEQVFAALGLPYDTASGDSLTMTGLSASIGYSLRGGPVHRLTVYRSFTGIYSIDLYGPNSWVVRWTPLPEK